MIDGNAAPVRDAQVTGERVGFALDTGKGQSRRFEGRLVDGQLIGDGWKAIRK